MILAGFGRLLAPFALALATIVPAHANNSGLEAQFDRVIGDNATPRSFVATYDTALERQIAELTSNARGRIGVAALDLTTGKAVSILGTERFPLASTSKIAIAAAFLEGVDQGRWSLDDKFPMMITPAKEGRLLTGRELIELAITRSSNEAADGLLRVVGGPSAVTNWVRRAGISQFSLDRYITTLVRQDGEIDPATSVDIWVLDLPKPGSQPGTPPTAKPFLKTKFSETQAALSPDGRWLAYQSNESGRFEIYVRAFPDGGAAQQVSTAGGIFPAWSRDHLFYRSVDNMLMSVAITPGAEFRSEAPQRLFDVTRYENSFGVPADGKRFLMLESTDVMQAPTAIALVQNFLAELRQRVK
jgi:hypothetical protein